MKSQVEAEEITAFVDGELDLARQLALEERARLDEPFKAQVDALRQLRQAIRQQATYHSAPAALRQRIASPPRQPRRDEPGAGWLAQAARRWFAWRPMIASLGMIAVVVAPLNWMLLRSMQDDRMLDDVVASHVRSTLGRHLIDVESSSHHTVKPWLSAQLDFSPPVAELPIPGSTLVGGRVDYLDGRPVAAVIYRQGSHTVNSFAWPGASRDSPVQWATSRGYQTAHWAHGGMNHWVISDLNPQELSTVVRAIQNADATP